MDLKGIGLVIIFLTLGQCTTKKSTDTETTDSYTTITKSTDLETTEQENYETFISRFNKDTVFQKDRAKYKFEKYYNLSLSRIDTSEFEISTRKSDNVVVRITNLKDTTYWVEYKFKKDKGNWYLIDYVDTYNN